jgi:hypothetical protein
LVLAATKVTNPPGEELGFKSGIASIIVVTTIKYTGVIL